MKNIFKKLSCALLVAAMICAITPFTASAATQKISYPTTYVSYMSSKSTHSSYGSFSINNIPTKSSISKSNVHVISGKNVVSLNSLNKNIWSNRSESFLKGVKTYVYSDHSYSIGFNMNKTGTAKISFKVGNKTYKTTIKVLPYTNPIKSLTVTGVSGNLASKAAAKCKEVELGTMNLDHIKKYEEELKNAGIDTGEVSPMLLPEYARHER